MANTRQSAKRARQAEKRQARNQLVKSQTKTAVRRLMDAVTKGDTLQNDAAKVTTAYTKAISSLDAAASKGVIPKKRASRKIARLTRLLAQKNASALPFEHKPKA